MGNVDYEKKEVMEMGNEDYEKKIEVPVEEKREKMGGFPIVIDLAAPLKHGAEDVERLVFRRPLKVGDLRGVKIASLSFDDFALIIGRMVGLPEKVIEQMEMADFSRAMEVISDFLPAGR